MTATKYDATLIEFDQRLTQFARRDLGFAATVTNLAHVRARISVIDEHRKSVFEVVKQGHAAGLQPSVPGVVLRETALPVAESKRVVPSAVIKKLDPKLWAASRVVRPRVSVQPPRVMKMTIRDAAVHAVGSLPRLPDNPTLDDAVVVYQSIPSTRELKQYEERYIEHLRLCAAIGHWDGLPIEFKDGWTFGLRTLLYDSDRLKHIAPELWDQLAVESKAGGGSRVYIGKIGADDVDSDRDAE